MAKGRGSDSNPGWPHSAIEMSKVVMPVRKKKDFVKWYKSTIHL